MSYDNEVDILDYLPYSLQNSKILYVTVIDMQGNISM